MKKKQQLNFWGKIQVTTNRSEVRATKNQPKERKEINHDCGNREYDLYFRPPSPTCLIPSSARTKVEINIRVCLPIPASRSYRMEVTRSAEPEINPLASTSQRRLNEEEARNWSQSSGCARYVLNIINNRFHHVKDTKPRKESHTEGGREGVSVIRR